MTGDETKFAMLSLKGEGFVTFGDNNKGKILGIRFMSYGSLFNVKNVLLVEGLKHNLIIISQLFDKGYKVVFEPSHYFIFDACGSIALIGKRVNNTYLIDLHHASNIIRCFLTKEDDTSLTQK